MYISAVANVSGSLLSLFVSWPITLKGWLSWTQPHLFLINYFLTVSARYFPLSVQSSLSDITATVYTSFWALLSDWFYNIPWMMKKLKGFCNSRWKLPQTAYNLLRSDQFWERSSDSTLLNLLWSHFETEYFRPSSENPLLIFFFSDEVEVWYDCLKATIDICFVHGLTENWDSTWTVCEQFTLWLKMLLLLKLSKACILTYSYDVYIVQKSVALSNQLINHAMNLLNDLTTDRACYNASFRSLVFVTHSLSGLVCKKVILLLQNNSEAHL